MPGRYVCELVKTILNPRYGPGAYWRGRSVEQSFHFTPSADGRYTLRLIAYGPNIELNVNGRLVLSHLTMPQRRGRVGLVLEDGRGVFSNVRITKLKAPTTNWVL